MRSYPSEAKARAARGPRQWNAGFASSHFVRLAPLRGSAELPTRGFSVVSWFA
jgi:hypothetical protein